MGQTKSTFLKPVLISALFCAMLFAASSSVHSAKSQGTDGIPLSPPNQASLQASQIVGVYRVISIASPGEDASACPATLNIGDPAESCGSNDSIAFNANGTVTFTATGEDPESGTWSVTGATVTVVGGSSTTTYLTTIHDNRVTLAEQTYHDTEEPEVTSDHVITNLLRRTSQTAAQIAGNYRIQSIAAPGNDASACPAVIGIGEPAESCGSNDIAVLNPNGTFTLSGDEGAENGSWSLTGDTLSLHTDSWNSTSAVSFSGTALTVAELTYQEPGDPNASSDGIVTNLTKLADVQASQLVGSYRVTSIGEPGHDADACPATLTIGDPLESCGTNDSIVLNANGTGSHTSTGETANNFTWSLSGSTLTIVAGTSTLTYLVIVHDKNRITIGELTYSDPGDPGTDSDHVVTNLLRRTSPTATQIVGSYKQTAIAAPSDDSDACPATVAIGEPYESCGSNDRIVINANGTMTLTNTGEAPETATWSLSGDTFTLHASDGTVITYAISLDGATLIAAELTYHDPAEPGVTSDGVVAYFTKQADEPVSLSINNAPASNEGSAAAPGSSTFTVTLSAASTQTVTVNFATANGTTNPALAGSDYVAKNGTLTFAPGELTKTITVSFIGDNDVEPNESFFVILSDPVNATLGKAQGTGAILNDDSGDTTAPTVAVTSPADDSALK